MIRRMWAMAVAVLLAMTAGCSGGGTGSSPAATTVLLERGTGDTLVELSRISEDVWMHTTYGEYEGSVVPSNGLLVETEDGVVLVDTPWTPEQTESLDELVRESFGVEIVGAVVTHAHPDRMGGAPYLRQEGIPITALQVVADRAAATGYGPVDTVLPASLATFAVGGTTFEVYYPGAGHTVDNTVVWVAEEGVLFAGCLVKELQAQNLGATAEADVDAWPASLRQVRDRYGAAITVVPGHGPWGDLRLADHTLALLEE